MATPQTHDIVTINGQRTRIEDVATSDYGIQVVTPHGGRFALDHSELTLAEAARGRAYPAVWACWTDGNGRRA